MTVINFQCKFQPNKGDHSESSDWRLCCVQFLVLTNTTNYHKGPGCIWFAQQTRSQTRQRIVRIFITKRQLFCGSGNSHEQCGKHFNGRPEFPSKGNPVKPGLFVYSNSKSSNQLDTGTPLQNPKGTRWRLSFVHGHVEYVRAKYLKIRFPTTRFDHKPFCTSSISPSPSSREIFSPVGRFPV